MNRITCFAIQQGAVLLLDDCCDVRYINTSVRASRQKKLISEAFFISMECLARTCGPDADFARCGYNVKNFCKKS